MSEPELRPSSTIGVITRIRFVKNAAFFSNQESNNGNYLKAWCQTSDFDYCPLVISVMSFVILTSFLTIVYLCAKTSFQWPSLRCALFTKWRRRRFDPCALRTAAREPIFSLSSSTNYINDSLSLHSVNQAITNRATRIETHRPPPVSLRSRALGWITGGSFKRSHADFAPEFLAAPPTYDESQQQISMMPTKRRSHVVRKHPIPTVTENAAFCMESSLSNEERGGSSININAAQFPAYRCLTLTAIRPQASSSRHIIFDENRCFQSTPVVRGVTENDTLSLAFDEVPPPYEAVIVGERSTSNAIIAPFNSSLSTRIANYSLRSTREFQI